MRTAMQLWLFPQPFDPIDTGNLEISHGVHRILEYEENRPECVLDPMRWGQVGDNIYAHYRCQSFFNDWRQQEVVVYDSNDGKIYIFQITE